MHGMDVECCVLVERVQIFKWIQVKNSIFWAENGKLWPELLRF